MKKHLALILSSILVASFALACSPKAPEDRIIKVIDTIYDKVDKNDGKNCAGLAEDLNKYCKGVSDELAKASKEVMPESAEDLLKEPTEAMKKIEAAFEKFEKLETSACAEDTAVKNALETCLTPMLPDMSEFD